MSLSDEAVALAKKDDPRLEEFSSITGSCFIQGVRYGVEFAEARQYAQPMVIYQVSNKVFSLLLSTREKAELFIRDNGTVASGLSINELQVF